MSITYSNFLDNLRQYRTDCDESISNETAPKIQSIINKKDPEEGQIEISDAVEFCMRDFNRHSLEKEIKVEDAKFLASLISQQVELSNRFVYLRFFGFTEQENEVYNSLIKPYEESDSLVAAGIINVKDQILTHPELGTRSNLKAFVSGNWDLIESRLRNKSIPSFSDFQTLPAVQINNCVAEKAIQVLIAITQREQAGSINLS